MKEPMEFDNELQERLLSLHNMVALALLAFEQNRHELLPTVLEEIHYKSQTILDLYCIV